MGALQSSLQCSVHNPVTLDIIKNTHMCQSGVSDSPRRRQTVEIRKVFAGLG